MLSDLEKTVTLVVRNPGSALCLRLLGKDTVFQYFSHVFNLEGWAAEANFAATPALTGRSYRVPWRGIVTTFRVTKRMSPCFRSRGHRRIPALPDLRRIGFGKARS